MIYSRGIIDEAPVAPVGFGDLYVRFPTAGTALKARAVLEGLHHQPRAHDDHVLMLERVEALPILRALVERLTLAERADSVALLKAAGRSYTADDSLIGLPIAVLRDRLSAGWLIDMLRERDFSVLFQPIVDAAAPATIFGYEATISGRRSGEVVSAERIYEVARHAELLTHFDQVAATRIFETILELRKSATFFVNVIPNRIYDPGVWIPQQHSYWSQRGIDPAQIVFEFVESEQTEIEHIQLCARIAREYGYRVALDDLGSGYASLMTLTRLKPDFVKFDKKLVQNVQDPYCAVIFSELLDATTKLGVPTIAEGIETQTQLDWVRRNGVSFVQGYLTGRPSPTLK
jgi:EAL domain-containing protein (putative c-di-GMP-specific phosphodiesterase class I)